MSTKSQHIIQTQDMKIASSDSKTTYLIGSIAENLRDGEYIINHIPIVVIFIRVDDWRPDIAIDEINITDKYKLRLSTGRTIYFEKKQIQMALSNKLHYRIVLLSDLGFSRYKINIQ